MIARNGRFTAVVAGLAVLAAVGCGGGGKKKTEVASTAVVPSGSTGTVSTGTSGVSQVPSQATTTPGGGTVTVPPVSTPTSDVYVTSFLLGQLQLIDAATLQVKQRIQVGKGPTSVTVNGSYVYVTNALDKNLVIVDRLTNTVVSTIDVSSTKVTGITAIDQVLQPLVRPTSVAVTPNGEKAFTANLLNVTSVDLIGRKPLKSIFALNLPSLSSGLSGLGAGITSFLTKPLAAAAPAKVACTKDHAWVTNLMTNNVTMISATDDKVISNLPVGRLPYGIATANGKVYVACAMTNEIVVLSEATGAPIRTIKQGLMPFDVTASPAGDKIYVANLAGGDVTEIDTALDIPVGTLPAGLPLASILTGMGINIPGGSGTGLSGALSGFLGGFLGGSTSGGAGSGTSTLGGLLGGLLGGSSGSSGGSGLGSILSPTNLVNALMSGLLGYMGINSSSISNFKLPGIGIASVTITAGGDKMVVGNWFMGTVTVTDLKTLQAGGLMPGTTGIGPASVAGAR